MNDFNVKEYTSSVTDLGNGVYAYRGDVSVYQKRFQDTLFFGFYARYIKFKDCVFEHCNFRCVDISHARFEGCSFRSCTFEHSNLPYCTFESCTFHSISSKTFSNSGMKAAKFRTCCMDCVSFAMCYAEDLYVNKCSNANVLQFTHCDLEHSSISPKYTDGVYFSRCNLLNAVVKPVRVDGKPVNIKNDRCLIDGTCFLPGHEARYGTILDEELIGYKKCKFGTIVKLRIPAGAVVFQPNMGKCRTNLAEVVDMWDSYGNAVHEARSKWDGTFTYRVGDVKRVDNFCLDPSVECAPGIHFFRTIEEAEVYE